MKSRKALMSLCVVVISILMVFAASPCAHAKKPTYILKCGSLAPDGIGWARLLKEMVNPGIMQVTDGDVVSDWYYGGVMGDDEDVIAKMRNDQLQGGFFSGAGAMQICPEITVLQLPFMFNNYEEVDLILKKYRKHFGELFEKRGYKLILLGEQDFDKLYSTNLELKDEASFRKSRMLTWYGPMETSMLKMLGANPIPVNVPEVCSSIRAGVIDSVISPALWAVGSQMYTTMKYINPMNIRYSVAAVIVTTQAWLKLPEKYRDAIETKCLELEQPYRNEIRAGNQKAYKAMLDYGMKEVKMTPAEVEEIKKRVLPVWDEFAANGTYPKSLLDEINQTLTDYRAGKLH
jgi:TRAP-type transport system periplasmic protein